MDGGFWVSIISFFKYPDPPLSDFLIITDQDQLEKAEAAMRALRNHHLKISGTVALLVLAFGWALTPLGFVRAGEFDKTVKDQVKSAQDSVQKSISELRQDQSSLRSDLQGIRAQTDATAAVVREILQGQIATNICRVVVRQKFEHDAGERSRLRTDADREQDRYKAIAGEFYPESRCGS